MANGLDLGGVLQQAEAIKGQRLQNQLLGQKQQANVLAQRGANQFNELLQGFISGDGQDQGQLNALIAADPQRASQFLGAQQQQQSIQAAQREQEKDEARQSVDAARSVLRSKSPKSLVRNAFPQFVEQLAEQGIDFESLDDAQIRQMANQVVSELSPVAGIDLVQQEIAEVKLQADKADLLAGASEEKEKKVNKQFDQIDKLIENSKRDKRVNDFIVVSSSSRRVESASPNAAGDLGLVFSFMKMLDPGSVVREGEQALARNAAGVPARIRTTYNNMLEGETLSPAQRAEFKAEAVKLLAGSRAEATKAIKPIIARAKRFGLRGESITEAVFGVDEPESQAGTGLPEGARIITTLSSGVRVIELADGTRKALP